MSVPSRPPVTSGQVPDEWCTLVHEVVQRYKHELRAMDYRISPEAENPPRYIYTIEVQSLNPPKHWAPLGLPSGSHLFVTAEDRDTVLDKIRSGFTPPAG